MPNLAQDTNGKVANSQLYIPNESQEVSPFSGHHKAQINRRAQMQQTHQFWETCKSLFIAEPRYDFNLCYEQQISKKKQLNTIYSSLFVILKRCKVQKTDIQGF